MRVRKFKGIAARPAIPFFMRQYSIRVYMFFCMRVYLGKRLENRGGKE